MHDIFLMLIDRAEKKHGGEISPCHTLTWENSVVDGMFWYNFEGSTHIIKLTPEEVSALTEYKAEIKKCAEKNEILTKANRAWQSRSNGKRFAVIPSEIPGHPGYASITKEVNP
jgi:hypothetical protein